MAEREPLPRVKDPDRWSRRLATALPISGLVALAVAFYYFPSTPGWGYDFAAYFNAAERLLLTGSPYQAETLRGPFNPGPFGLYLYPPLLAVVLQPAVWIGEHVATSLWFVARVGLLALACAVMPVQTRIKLMSFGVAAVSPFVMHDLNLGNVSVVVTALSIFAWRWLDRPAGSVAVAFGLMLRPGLAVLLAWWALRGKLRPVAWTLVAAAVIVLFTIPLVGLAGYTDYVTVLRNASGMTGAPNNVDLGSTVLRLGLPNWLATPALFAGYGVAAGAIILSLRRDRELSFVVTLGASLLLAPLLWNHYLVGLLVPAAFLASRGFWWGLLLPILGWLPGSYDPTPLLPVLAIAAVALPFLAPDAGESAGTLLDRARLSSRRSSAPLEPSS